MALQILDTIIHQVEIHDLIHHINKGLGCLDTRNISSLSKHRLLNATCIHENELENRLFELPRKNIPFILIANSKESNNILKQNGYINFIEFSLTDSHWTLLQHDYNELLTSNKINYIPLFNPCSPLKSHIDQIEKYLYKTYSDEKTNENTIIKLKCCDIGCGSGRDDIWLCLRNVTKGIEWNSDCIDYNFKILERLSQFALNANVSEKISIIKSKIRGDCKINLYENIYDDKPFSIYDFNSKHEQKMDSENLFYFQKKYDLIICVRFLERFMVNKLWKSGKMLKRNGYLLMFTFMEGAEKFGKPKNKNYLLKKGELKQIFSDQTMFKIIVDNEVVLDDGRPMQAFLCQKIVD
eukprot:547383_1